MANFRYSMRGRRSTFAVRRLDSLPIAGLNCSVKIRLPIDAFPCMISARRRSTTTHEAGIAQLVEQLICNQQVIGSNPIAGSVEYQRLTWFAPCHQISSLDTSWTLFQSLGG